MNRRQFLALSAAAATARGESSASGPLLSFGLITDVQYADADPIGERHYRESLPKLKEAAADLAKQKLPFSLHLGDVIDRDFASYATVLPLLEPLGHPVRHLMGNHDFSIPDGKKPEVAKLLGMPADHYAFTISGVRFVMLDTNEMSLYKHGKGSPEHEASKEALAALAKKGKVSPNNGGPSAGQLAWLEKELAEADAARTPVIVCGHHTVLPEAGHNAWNRKPLVETILRHRSARAYFCGHHHAGAQVIVEGVPFITFKSLLHEPGVTAYSVVRLFDDRLVIEGRGRETSREVPLREQ